jgi:hypothetical protein
METGGSKAAHDRTKNSSSDRCEQKLSNRINGLWPWYGSCDMSNFPVTTQVRFTMMNRSTRLSPQALACVIAAPFAIALLYQLGLHADAMLATVFGFCLTFLVQVKGTRRLRPRAIRR